MPDSFCQGSSLANVRGLFCYFGLVSSTPDSDCQKCLLCFHDVVDLIHLICFIKMLLRCCYSSRQLELLSYLNWQCEAGHLLSHRIHFSLVSCNEGVTKVDDGLYPFRACHLFSHSLYLQHQCFPSVFAESREVTWRFFVNMCHLKDRTIC